MTEPTQIDWARLAAYIDGEGTIALDSSSQGNNRARGQRLRVLIYNSDLRLLAWCKGIFGGQVRLNRKGNPPKHLPLYQWSIVQRQAALVLQMTMEFMIIKREQAELGIAYWETFSPSNRDPRGMRPHILAKREQLRSKIAIIRRSGGALAAENPVEAGA